MRQLVRVELELLWKATLIFCGNILQFASRGGKKSTEILS